MDPRISIISKRLEKIGRTIAVSGGKGGVGKSMVASNLALILSEIGYKVGLIDLDFTSPSIHTILGVKKKFPKEDKGIVPPEVYGIKFMSIYFYSGDNVLPLRGKDVSNIIIELLTITRWGSLDFLIIDIPPGIRDTSLDIIRLIRGIELFLVTLESKLAIDTIRKIIKLAKENKVPILGVVENMSRDNFSIVKEEMKKIHIDFLGEIRFDDEIEDALGNKEKLLKTKFIQDLRNIVSKGLEM